MISLVLVIGLFQFAVADDERSLETVDWETFSDNLVNAFQVGNEGVKLAAMQNIITYSDYLDVRDAAFDLVRIYRHHKDQRVRQMAVVALHKINNNWAMHFLERSLKFEKNPTIAHQIACCVLKKKNMELTDAENSVATLIADLER